MTGVELKEYLMSIPNFFRYDPNYMVESIDGEIYNHVPTNYKAFIQMLGKIEIRIYYNKHGDATKWVDFTIGGTNLYACHKLKDMTFETLYTELNKIMGRDQRFIEWSKIELRNYKIDSLYEV
jgi:hypothetical protein